MDRPTDGRRQISVAVAWFILFGRCGVGVGGRRLVFLAAMAASSGKAQARVGRT